MTTRILFSIMFVGAGWIPPAQLRGGEANSSVENGDVNGDGRRNISDAHYLLNWLFLGGPAPHPVATVPELLEEIEVLRAQLAMTEESHARATAELESLAAELANCTGELKAAASSLATCENALVEAERGLFAATERVAELETPGCTDRQAVNYDCAANIDDGSCVSSAPCDRPSASLFETAAYSLVLGHSDGLDGGRSGMAYREDNDSLYLVSDEQGDRVVRVLNPFGEFLGEAALPRGNGPGEFEDPEGIVWMGRDGATSDTFAILDEGDSENPVRIHVLEILPGAAIEPANVTTFVCSSIPVNESSPGRGNLGAEGLTRDPHSGVFYVAGQSTQQGEDWERRSASTKPCAFVPSETRSTFQLTMAARFSPNPRSTTSGCSRPRVISCRLKSEARHR